MQKTTKEITEKINKNANDMMKKWIAHNQEKPQHLTVEQLCDILLYKSENLEADIPKWVYLATFNVLLKAYGSRFAFEDGVKIN